MAYHPFRHLGLKFVSLGLAVLLWLVIAREPTVERNMRVPLQFQNMPSELQLVGEPPSSVDVRVRGSSGQLSRLEPGAVVAILDLKSARAGFRMFNLFAEHVNVPFGVSVEQVLTPSVPLEFERIGVRIVPVVPAIEGEPAPGYVVGPVSANPATVEIVGPESRLRQVIEATTDPVSVDGATAPVTAIVTVGVTDPALRLREARTTTVTVQVLAGSADRTMPGAPVQGRGLADGLAAAFAPGIVSVTVRGPRERLDQLTVEALSAYVDLSTLGPGEHQVTVRLEPIRGVTFEAVSPSDILVRIK